MAELKGGESRLGSGTRAGRDWGSPSLSRQVWLVWLVVLASLLSVRVEASLSFSRMASEQGSSPPLTCCRTESNPCWPLCPCRERLNGHLIPIPLGEKKIVTAGGVLSTNEIKSAL